MILFFWHSVPVKCVSVFQPTEMLSTGLGAIRVFKSSCIESRLRLLSFSGTLWKIELHTCTYESIVVVPFNNFFRSTLKHRSNYLCVACGEVKFVSKRTGSLDSTIGKNSEDQAPFVAERRDFAEICREFSPRLTPLKKRTPKKPL